MGKFGESSPEDFKQFLGSDLPNHGKMVMLVKLGDTPLLEEVTARKK